MNNFQDTFDTILLEQIAHQYGTPCYVYSKQKIIENLNQYYTGFKQHNKEQYLVCYAVKANSNLSILKLLSKNNAGFDIVSVGELQRVIKAGGDPKKVVFSGVGKQDFEIKAALQAEIYCFNVESEPELILINKIAQELNLKAPVSIRVNPDIDAKSHPYISTGLKDHKFGIAIKQAEKVYNYAKELTHINIIGVDCHIGSQLTELNPIKDTCDALNKLIKNLASNHVKISHVNLGGGLGINYQHDKNSENNALPNACDWVSTILNNLDFAGKI